MLIYFLRDFHNMNIRHIESDATDICKRAVQTQRIIARFSPFLFCIKIVISVKQKPLRAKAHSFLHILTKFYFLLIRSLNCKELYPIIPER